MAYSELNWRRMFLAVPFTPDVFNSTAFLAALGEAELPDQWLLESEADPDMHAHVHLDQLEAPSTGEHEPDASRPEANRSLPHNLFDVRVYPSAPALEKVPDQSNVGRSNFKSFFKALAVGFTAADSVPEELRFSVYVVLRFASERAVWRLPLLEDPPKLLQLSSEMGSVSLAGVRLRFEGAPTGLLAAQLDTRNDDNFYRLALAFKISVPLPELDKLLDLTLAQTRSLALQFLDYEFAEEEVGNG